jgi:tetratricopeptide (TPR) repeat protein
MPSFSRRPHSPTLLALALACMASAPLAAATATERDNHFKTVQAVIDRELRLPAERLRAEYTAAGYPEDAWHRKALDWFYADRFRTSLSDATAAAALDKQATSLRAELDAAEKAGSLPPAVAALMSGAGDGTRRAVNEIARLLHPDGVEPVVPPAPEKIAAAKRNLDLLVEAMPKRFGALIGKIKANADKEKDIWDYAESDPKGQALIQEATLMRSEAVDALYMPHIVLREIITRGEVVGLDGTAAARAYAVVLKEHAAALADWEYNFGDSYPPLKAHANMVLAEAVRQKVADIKIEDVEAGLLAVIDTDLKQFRGPLRTQMVNLQLGCWAALLRTRLELGGAANLKAGLKHFQDFLDHYKADPAIKPGATNEFVREIGAIYILAARLRAASGDGSGANALLGQVAANKRSPQVDNARGWMRKLSGSGGAGAGSSWGEPVTPQDPAQALSVAKALMSEANQTADEKLARSQNLAAAVGLRAGVAGLAGAWSDQMVDTGPELYDRYAVAMSRLGMRVQAALVAAEGLRVCKAVIDANPKANPWRSGPKQEWTEAGKKLGILARNALSHGNALAGRLKGTGIQSLNGEIIELAKAVAPEETGKNTEWQQVVILAVEKNWDLAIQKANEYRKAYPEDAVKVFGLITSAHMGRYDQAKEANDKAAMKAAADGMGTFASEIQTYIDQARAKGGLSAAQDKDLARAAGTIKASKIAIMIGNGEFAEVLAALDAEFWKNPPSDETLLTRLLRNYVTAAQQLERARIKGPSAQDPKALVAAWPTYKEVYETYARILPRIKDPDEIARAKRASRVLADLFNVTSATAEQLKAKPDAPAELDEIAKLSKRWFADCLEQVMTDQEKPEVMLAVAFTLWDIDEHERAARLLTMYTKKVGENPEFKAFKSDAKGALDPVEALVANRPELKGDWAKVRDLIEDQPALKQEREQGVPFDKLSEKPRDFSKALGELRKLRNKVGEMKTKLGDQATAAVTELTKLEKLVTGTLQEQMVWKRLAMAHREAGRADKAREIFLKLYEEDPDDPMVATSVVDITVDQVKAGGAVSKPDIEKALAISKGIRNDNENNPTLYWTAAIQVYELTAALGTKDDLDYINKAMRFDAVNQSDPSHSLITQRISEDARQVGDDKAVRRAANALAVELARRYLKLYELPGVTQKPSFRIDEIQLDGKPLTIFVPIEAGTFEARTVTTEDERELAIIVKQGTAEVQKPEVPAAAAPAPAPAAPTPAPEAKP